MSNTHTNPTELTKRLTALMVEAINHPHHDYILRDLAEGLHNFNDLECRMSTQLVFKLVTLTQHACTEGEMDHDESAGFYASEATFDRSDFKPAEMRRYSREYQRAAKAYAKCFQALHKAVMKLDADIDASGI